MASLKSLRLITFDVTNTLLQYRTTPGKQYGEIGALFGVLCDNNDLAKNYKANWYKMNRTYPNFGRNSGMDWQQWWRHLIANTFADSGAQVPAEKLENFANHLLELNKTSICWQQCNGSADLLKYLRLQHPTIVLGVISNFDTRLNVLLRNMKIDQFFKFALNSYDCKVEKPSAEIFEMAMRASGLQELQAVQCLHIGDGPTTDYLAARDAGWHAALLHEKSFNYLNGKYGDKIDERFVFPSMYDFHKKLLNNTIDW